MRPAEQVQGSEPKDSGLTWAGAMGAFENDEYTQRYSPASDGWGRFPKIPENGYFQLDISLKDTISRNFICKRTHFGWLVCLYS